MRLSKRTPETDLWRTCLDLTASADWHSFTVDSNTRNFSHERTVTWARYPNRYMLHELGLKKRLGRSIVTVMFDLASLSTRAVDTELHTYSRYFIYEGEVSAAFHSNVSLPDNMSEEEVEGLRSGYGFSISHRLCVPSAEDTLGVELVVQEAYMDGVVPYERRV